MISLYDSNITDILPDSLKSDPKTQALGYALKEANQRLLDYCANISVFAVIDELPDEIVDLLAIELRTQYYDETLPLQTKRNLVKNTFLWYQNAGTTKTLKELIRTVFGEGEIIEWWQEEDAEPYTFKIQTDAPVSGDDVEAFAEMIKNIINIRSHLTAIEISRTASGNVYGVVGQSSYTISKDIKEGGI